MTLTYIIIHFVSSQDCVSACTRLQNRGPDSSSQADVIIDQQNHLVFTGHVLHMRGPLTPQPARNKRGCCLLWNGEIFGGLQVIIYVHCPDLLLNYIRLSGELKFCFLF